MADKFNVGDRVKICGTQRAVEMSTRQAVEVGILGSVEHVFEDANGYIIVFDSLPAPQFVWASLLEPSDREAVAIIRQPANEACHATGEQSHS